MGPHGSDGTPRNPLRLSSSALSLLSALRPRHGGRAEMPETLADASDSLAPVRSSDSALAGGRRFSEREQTEPGQGDGPAAV